MDFNTTKDTYREKIESTLAFAGKGLDFYTNVKADSIAQILAQLGHVSPKLLDVGCGHGFIHPKLVNLGCEIFGVETASEVLKLAQKTNPKVNYLAYDGFTLPFSHQSFDVVMAICVMHHVAPSQWLTFLSEARRVLRPGGSIIIFEHNPLNPLTRYVVAQNEIDDDAVLLSHRKLNELLGLCGFRNIHSRFILFTPFSNSYARQVDNFLSKIPFGAQYYSTATV